MQYIPTKSITNYSEMFSNCKSLTTLDLRGFKPNNEANLSSMFKNCSNLTTIISNEAWSTKGSSNDMFAGCTSLKGATAFSSSNLTVAAANPTTGYFSQAVDINVSAAGYATYYNGEKAVLLPKGVKAYTIDAVSSTGILTLNEKYAGGSNTTNVVPKGTGILLQAEQGTYALAFVPLNTASAPEGNMLRGSDVDSTTVGGDLYYKLSYNNAGDKLGFYWANSTGAAFTNKAHKAYLVVTGPSGAKFSGFTLDGSNVTAIENVIDNNNYTGKIYNILGQEVKNPVNGLYIVNGRKVLMK